MLAAERGGAAQHARGLYAATSTILPPISPARGETLRDRQGHRPICAAISATSPSADSRPASVARRLSAIRQLYRFLYAEGHRGDDPGRRHRRPQARPPAAESPLDRRGRPPARDRAAGRRCDASAPMPERLRALRLVCLLEVLYATGLRISELMALPATAARRDERMLIMRGKGGKERLVPLNEAAKAAMREYLDCVAQTGAGRPVEMAVSVLRRERPPDPSARRTRIQEPSRRRRARRRTRQPACAAPRVRQPPAAERRRSARRADAARPCRHLDHANLYPRAGRASEEPGARSAPAGGR